MSKDISFEKRIDKVRVSCEDIRYRRIIGPSDSICVFYIKQLTDLTRLSEDIIKPFVQYYHTEPKDSLTAQLALESILYVGDCSLDHRFEQVVDQILDGQTVILFSEEEAYLVANIKKIESKAIEPPALSYTLRGPQDSFIENVETNISLIRYRIKDPNLKLIEYRIGKRTRTHVVLFYIEDIANHHLVSEVQKRLLRINTDGFIESGELQLSLQSHPFKFFPEMGLVERSDMACGALLEGKVIVMVEGSSLALVAPKTFLEFFWSSEDNYENQYHVAFSKLLRLTAIFFSISLSSVFIIVTSFNFDVLPPEFVITIAVSRANVPFTSFIGVLILEVLIEILREALIRIPKQIGTAVGIVGATIIGQAAISSGIFSPLLLILVSISFLSSFVSPDYSIMNSLRLLKFLLIFLTGTMGLLGYTFGLYFIMTLIISTNSFGYPYLTPIAPFHFSDFFRIFYNTKKTAPDRPNFLRTKDKKRSN